MVDLSNRAKARSASMIDASGRRVQGRGLDHRCDTSLIPIMKPPPLLSSTRFVSNLDRLFCDPASRSM
jgi:hypothetical protein